MIPLTPKGPTVLLKTKVIEETTESGIIVRSSKESSRETVGNNIFQVVAMGSGAFNDMPGVGTVDPYCKVGDFVMTARYPGIKFEYPKDSGEIYYLCNDDDIRATLTPELAQQLSE